MYVICYGMYSLISHQTIFLNIIYTSLIYKIRPDDDGPGTLMISSDN